MSDILSIERDIQTTSEQLAELGAELRAIANRLYELKFENEKHEHPKRIRLLGMEEAGQIEWNGKKVRVTDSVRDAYARDGRSEEFAEYEALKRKLEATKAAVDALTAAQSGLQSRANIIKAEMQILQYQP